MWRLIICDNNAMQVSVCGTYDVLRTELDAWRAYVDKMVGAVITAGERGDTYEDHEGQRVRVIHGVNDEANRRECILAVRWSDIAAMSLVEI